MLRMNTTQLDQPEIYHGIQEGFQVNKPVENLLYKMKLTPDCKVAGCKNTYHIYVFIDELLKASKQALPENVNPRSHKNKKSISGIIPSNIQKTLKYEPEKFTNYNKGITCLVKDFKYNEETHEVIIDFGRGDEYESSKNALYGVVDGMTTLHKIDSLKDDPDVKYSITPLHIEVMIVDKEMNREHICKIATARNSIRQVKEASKQNFLGNYDKFKDIIKNEPYADKIMYEENSTGVQSIGSILSIINLFNPCWRIPKSPLSCYDASSKVVTLLDKTILDDDTRKEEADGLQKIISFAPEILKLYDVVHESINKYEKLDLPKITKKGFPKRQEHQLDFKTYEVNKTYLFSGRKKHGDVPKSFIFSIVASLRCLLKDKNDKVTWTQDPIKFWKKHQSQMIYTQFFKWFESGKSIGDYGKVEPAFSFMDGAINDILKEE